MWHSKVASKVNEVYKRYDFIHIVGAINSPIILEINDDAREKCFLSAIDSFSLFFKRRSQHSSLIKKMLFLREAKIWEEVERKYFKLFRKVHLVSEVDEKHLRGFGLNNCFTIENGVSLSEPLSSFEYPKRIVFWGDLGYAPNKSAVEFLVENIGPRVELEIHLFGKNLDRKYLNSSEYALHYHGFVDSVKNELRNGDIFVCPLPFGTGIKNKVLESLSFGLPSIVSPAAIEGVGCTNGEHLLLVSDMTIKAWLDQIQSIIDNPKNAESISKKGRKFIEMNFSWESKREKLRDIYEASL